jgi:predicted O-methyltransferase YrrM
MMINYIPENRKSPKLVNVPSAWDDIPTILDELLVRFNLKAMKALEFGVDQGFSTSALANYFKKVIGVDTFGGTGLEIERNPDEELNKIQDILKEYPNIELVKETADSFMQSHPKNRFDLIHIDLSPHTYDNINRLHHGLSSIQNAF